jgi:hypothetical protein
MKNKLGILFCISFISACAFSQSNVQLLDILVHPVFEYDTITNQPVVTENEQLNIMFKINDASNADKVYVLFGTEQDAGNVISISADIVTENDLYYVLYNGEQQQINGYTAQMTVELTPEQNQLYNYISLFVKDEQEQESNRLYFVK